MRGETQNLIKYSWTPHHGGAGGLVALPIFKIARGAVMPSRVGSIPTRSRHLLSLSNIVRAVYGITLA